MRTTPRTSTPEEDRKRLLTLVLIAASGILALGLVIAFLAFGTSEDGGAGGGSFAEEMTAAGYTLKSYPALANEGNHSDVPSVDTKVKWNSNPPTSGPHYQQWAVWNFYETPVPLTMSTHNLEHGGIVIHYGPQVPEAELDKLRSFYNGDPNAMLVAPLPSAGNKVIASAWYYDLNRGEDDEEYLGEGKQITGTKVDEDGLAAFRDEFRYKGRERIPAENLQPGL